MNSQVCHRSCPFSHFSSQHTTPCRHSYLCIQFQLLNWSGIKVICSIKDFFIKNPCSTKKMLFKIRTFSCIKLMFIYVYCFPYSFLPKSGWCSYAKISLYDPSTYRISLNNRRPVPSTDQALPSCFYFRISWILMERPLKHFFGSCGFLEGLRSLKQWLLQKVSMKNLDKKFKFLIKK